MNTFDPEWRELTEEHRPPRILVAEDNDAMLRVITRALHRAGYEVEHAHDGGELMHWVEAMTDSRVAPPRIDLIVTDERMPRHSGRECVERLKAFGNETPVILISAFANLTLRKLAHDAGVKIVFAKPVDLGELCSAVSHTLSA